MKMQIRTALFLILIMALTPLFAQDEPSPTYSFKFLTPEVALKAALGAQKACRDAGYQVTVAVVDRTGNLQVLLRDRLAGHTTVEFSQLKAQTAASFRSTTSEIAETTFNSKDMSGIRHGPGFIALGGGLPVQAAGEIVAAIGVAGAPQPKEDEKCASAGAAAIEDLLAF